MEEFKERLKRIGVAELVDELERVQQKIQHLIYSNQELKTFSENLEVDEEDRQIYKETYVENEEVIKRLYLRKEIMEEMIASKSGVTFSIKPKVEEKEPETKRVEESNSNEASTKEGIYL
ncbi:hypothetical protein K502DRAFT_331367 [Neoconidiobolus thromboides FSU 785]|nr:hypothetical protein K502DRAFT_331367 [Neoconidiobolus thromboides FSU 785]